MNRLWNLTVLIRRGVYALIMRLLGKAVLPPGIRVGRNVHIGDASRFDVTHGRHITICDEATIALGVRILCHDASSQRRIGATYVAPVTIGERAFVGTEAVIMPGVTIGRDAIVAAGAVVTRNVEPGMIMAGVPAVPIGTTKDLDERRRQQIAIKRIFDSRVYACLFLSAEIDAELRKVAEEDGGYFLT